MTTIAYRDGIMASDTAIWDAYGIYFGQTKKLYRLSDGRVLGVAGSKSMSLLVAAWMNGTADRPEPNEERAVDRFNGLLVGADKRVFYLDISLEPSELIVCPFTAIGSGRELALGAMAMGASAAEACCVAAEFDNGSRAPIVTEVV